jgi:hypothetical protein
MATTRYYENYRLMPQEMVEDLELTLGSDVSVPRSCTDNSVIFELTTGDDTVVNAAVLLKVADFFDVGPESVFVDGLGERDGDTVVVSVLDIPLGLLHAYEEEPLTVEPKPTHQIFLVDNVDGVTHELGLEELRQALVDAAIQIAEGLKQEAFEEGRKRGFEEGWDEGWGEGNEAGTVRTLKLYERNQY